jgi:hypothetical protein
LHTFTITVVTTLGAVEALAGVRAALATVLAVADLPTEAALAEDVAFAAT